MNLRKHTGAGIAALVALCLGLAACGSGAADSPRTESTNVADAHGSVGSDRHTDGVGQTAGGTAGAAGRSTSDGDTPVSNQADAGRSQDGVNQGNGSGSVGSAGGGTSPSTPVSHAAESDFPTLDMIPWVEANRSLQGQFFFTFGDTRYIMISAGEKPHAGWGVKVSSVQVDEDHVAHLQVRWTEPQAGQAYAEMIAYPHDIVATPASVLAYDLQYDGEGAPQSPGVVEPNIVVAGPQPGATLDGKLHLTGKARAFEGTVQVYLEDGHNVLLQKTLQGEGAPAWMTLDETFDFDTPTNNSGLLMVYVSSPRDGSKQDVVMMPVKFKR